MRRASAAWFCCPTLLNGSYLAEVLGQNPHCSDQSSHATWQSPEPASSAAFHSKASPHSSITIFVTLTGSTGAGLTVVVDAVLEVVSLLLPAHRHSHSTRRQSAHAHAHSAPSPCALVTRSWRPLGSGMARVPSREAAGNLDAHPHRTSSTHPRRAACRIPSLLVVSEVLQDEVWTISCGVVLNPIRHSQHSQKQTAFSAPQHIES